MVHLPLILTCLLGCAASVGGVEDDDDELDAASAATKAKARGYTEQYKLLSKGYVTKSDVETAFNNFKRHMTDYGYDVSEAVWNPLDNHSLLFRVAPNGLDADTFNQRMDDCDNRYYRLVQMAYQTTHEAVVDPPIMVSILRCLDDRGVAYDKGAANLADLGPDASARDQLGTLSDCVVSAMNQHHPEIEDIAFGW